MIRTLSNIQPVLGTSCQEYKAFVGGYVSFEYKNKSNEPLDQTPLIARKCDTSLMPVSHSLRFRFDDFLYVKALGSGAMGLCLAAYERRTFYPVALKIICKTALIRSQKEELIRTEIELQSHLQHPHIVPLYTWFHDEERIALVLQYCRQGDLFQHLYKNRGSMNEVVTSRCLFDVIWAIRHCHANRIAHLDLKPENIMVHNDRLLLADFGMSVHTVGTNNVITTNRGTQDYFSPEQLHPNSVFGSYNHKADIWAIGILAYEILFGKPPFGSQLDKTVPKNQIFENIRKSPWDINLKVHMAEQKCSAVSAEFRSFVSACLKKKAFERLTAEQLLEHEFIVKHNADRFKDSHFISEPYHRGRGFNS